MHLLRDEVYANAQTTKSLLDFNKNVRGKDHDHEGVSILDHEAVQLKSFPILGFKNLHYIVCMSEHEAWLQHLQ